MKYPEYAWIIRGDNKVALQLSHNEPGEPVEYYRHAGHWSVSVKEMEGKIIVDDRCVKHLNGLELIKCTKEEWKNDNKGYV
jgi:hypothetical protein